MLPSPPLAQVLDPQLDALAHALLKQLRQLDSAERAVGAQAGGVLAAAAGQGGGPRPARRLVGGLREVRAASAGQHAKRTLPWEPHRHT